MSTAGRDGHRRRFLFQLGAAVVTLGLYMPVWLARREAEVREHVGDTEGESSAWALGAGAALGILSRAVFGEGSPGLALGASLLAVAVFLVGVYQALHRVDRACRSAGVEAPPAPAAGTGLVGLAFLGVELGNRFDTWLLRGPVLVLVATLPYAFWRLHLACEVVLASPGVTATS